MMKTSFKVKFVFEDNPEKHLTYFVQENDLQKAEEVAKEQLGQKGRDSITSVSITPLVLNDIIGKKGKVYENFKDQISDDPRMIELAFMWMRGNKAARKGIEAQLKGLFDPLDSDYTKQAISTLKLMASFVAYFDFSKYGKKHSLEGLN
jgi:hypothetical protein